jgi:hypothetical protein
MEVLRDLPEFSVNFVQAPIYDLVEPWRSSCVRSDLPIQIKHESAHRFTHGIARSNRRFLPGLNEPSPRRHMPLFKDLEVNAPICAPVAARGGALKFGFIGQAPPPAWRASACGINPQLGEPLFLGGTIPPSS